MPVWTYANGSTLFETERPEAHAREALSSYLDQVALVKALLQSASRQKLLDTFDLDIEPVGQFSAWRDVYYEDIRQSKAVLQERSEESAFIACVKCRSNAVDTEQKQTRSADEPMTIFCLCRKCGKRFTMH